MTVDEAKNKMCPYVFMSYFMPGNIRGETPCNSRCQADQCMAWRWNDPEIKNEGYCGLVRKEGAE